MEVTLFILEGISAVGDKVTWYDWSNDTFKDTLEECIAPATANEQKARHMNLVLRSNLYEFTVELK